MHKLVTKVWKWEERFYQGPGLDEFVGGETLFYDSEEEIWGKLLEYKETLEGNTHTVFTSSKEADERDPDSRSYVQYIFLFKDMGKIQKLVVTITEDYALEVEL